MDHVIDFNRRLVAAAGRDTPLTLRRSNATRAVTVRLVKESDYFDARLVRRRLGILLEATTAGLVIKSVDADGPAAGRIAPGMVLDGMDGQGFADIMGLAKALNGKKPGDRADLLVAAYRRTGPFVRRDEGVVNLAVR